MFQALISRLKPQKLSREAFDAYFYRLPESIQVNWIRDGKMIVGKVSDGKKEFMTQGRSADEFVEMVNDAICTVYGIPASYSSALRQVKSFVPDQQERQKLEDTKITTSSFPAVRNSKVLKTA